MPFQSVNIQNLSFLHTSHTAFHKLAIIRCNLYKIRRMSRIIEMARGVFGRKNEAQRRTIENPEAKRLRSQAEKLWIDNLNRANVLTFHVWNTLVNLDEIIDLEPLDQQLLTQAVALEFARKEVQEGPWASYQKIRLRHMIAEIRSKTQKATLATFSELPAHLQRTDGAMETYLGRIDATASQIIGTNLSEPVGRQQDYAYRVGLPVYLTLIQLAKAGHCA